MALSNVCLAEIHRRRKAPERVIKRGIYRKRNLISRLAASIGPRSKLYVISYIAGIMYGNHHRAIGGNGGRLMLCYSVRISSSAVISKKKLRAGGRYRAAISIITYALQYSESGDSNLAARAMLS